MIPPADQGPDGARVTEPGAWLDSASWSSRYHRLGPLRYSDLGRRRLTPPSHPGPLSRWLATAADTWWAAKGRPDPFTLVVVSGDDGRLASGVLEAEPECGPALRYVLVHPDLSDPANPPPSMAMALPLENPAFLYPAAPGPPDGAEADEDAETRPAQGIGPMVTLLADLPGLGDAGAASAVVAVEFLSRLAFDAFERAPDGAWSEVRLAADLDGPAAGGSGPAADRDGPAGAGALTEIRAPLAEAPAGVDAEAAAGRYVRWTGALHWLRRVVAAGDTSTLAVLDQELPERLLAAVGRLPEPAAGVAGTPLRSVQWRLD